jgi:exodeoxyribonuclease VII large subunit
MMLFGLDTQYPSGILTVTQLTRRLQEIIESDPLLRDVWLRGEVSNLTQASSGHVYFTLKDELSAIRCVVWKSAFTREMRVHLQEGASLELHGFVGIYERSGQYQLYVDAIRPAGEGALFQEFLRLKAKLEAEGLFVEQRKRPIPAFPRKIGLVTSPTGAALQDMLNILRSRFPIAEVVLAGTSVQGESAPAEIVAALDRLNRREQPDVILLARGGGSLEDLWAFNDERVVRAIVRSDAPIISGVGHETDFTLSDFAADLRAPTPTAAAVAAVPDIHEIKVHLGHASRDLIATITDKLIFERSELKEIAFNLERNSPQRYLLQASQHLDELNGILSRTIGYRMGLKKENLVHLSAHLHSLNPNQVLKRGYAMVTDQNGRMLTSIRRVTPGQAITVRIQDGKMQADVTRTEPDSKINRGE